MAWLIKTKRKRRGAARKETYWSVQWRAGGRTHTRAIGFLSAAEARRSLKIFEGKLAAGEAVEPEEQNASGPGSTAPTPRVPTLRRYLEDVFLPVVERDKARKTAEEARRASNALNGILGDLPLPEIDYAVVDLYLSKRRALGRRSRTLILELRCLKQGLTHARDCGVLELVPKLPTLKDRDRKPHKYLTEAESIALLDALRPLDDQPHRVTRGRRPPVTRDALSYLAVLMALNTGMRRNEILSRCWQDLRWEQGRNGSLLVCARPEIGFRVKKDRERVVPLTPDLRLELQHAHERVAQPGRGWIFPSPKDPAVPRKEFRNALRRACERAGVPRLHPHGLRHTWASRLAMAGVPRSTLMELGGWKEGRMLDEIYAHVTDDHIDEVMDRMGISSSADETPRPPSGE